MHFNVWRNKSIYEILCIETTLLLSMTPLSQFSLSLWPAYIPIFFSQVYKLTSKRTTNRLKTGMGKHVPGNDKELYSRLYQSQQCLLFSI